MVQGSDKRLLFAMVLNIVGLLTTCAMLAGASTSCADLKNTRWGFLSFGEGQNYYFGLRGACVNVDANTLVFTHYKDFGTDVGDNCISAGKASLAFTVFLFFSYFATLALLYLRMSGDHSKWKPGVLVCLFGTTC